MFPAASIFGTHIGFTSRRHIAYALQDRHAGFEDRTFFLQAEPFPNHSESFPNRQRHDVFLQSSRISCFARLDAGRKGGGACPFLGVAGWYLTGTSSEGWMVVSACLGDGCGVLASVHALRKLPRMKNAHIASVISITSVCPLSRLSLAIPSSIFNPHHTYHRYYPRQSLSIYQPFVLIVIASSHSLISTCVL